MESDQDRLERMATRALFIRQHPEKYTPEVRAWADGPLMILNPRRGEEGEPATIPFDPTTIEIRKARHRADLGLPPLGAPEPPPEPEAEPASEPVEVSPMAAEPEAAPEPEAPRAAASEEPPAVSTPPAPKLGSRKRATKSSSK